MKQDRGCDAPIKELTRRQMVRNMIQGCAACVGLAAIGRNADASDQPTGAELPLGKAAFPITRSAIDAEAMFRQGFNCAQAVLCGGGRRLGLPDETGKRIGAAFGGGIAGLGLTCGAVTGALMCIGLKHAKVDVNDHQAAGRTQRLARQFTERFSKVHGSICCNDLLGVDISTDTGFRQAVQDGTFTARCPVYVRDAAALLEQLLVEEDQAADENAEG